MPTDPPRTGAVPVFPRAAYPGIHIAETTEQQHAIVPASTAITASVGRAAMEPVEQPATTPPDDVACDIVNIMVSFAPTEPGAFLVITLQHQMMATG